MAERPWKLNDTAPLPLAQEASPPAPAGAFAPHATPMELAAFALAAPPWDVAWWGGLASMVQPAGVDLVLTDGGGIGSAEACGAGSLTLTLAAGGRVPSGEAFGAGTLGASFPGGGGAASTEAFGVGSLLIRFGGGGGTPSTETFGSGLVLSGPPEEPPPEEEPGISFLPIVIPLRRTRRRVLGQTRGIASAEAFGRGRVVHTENEPAEEDEAAAVLLLGGGWA